MAVTMTGKRKFWLGTIGMICITAGNLTGNIPGERAAFVILGIITALTGGYIAEYWKQK